MTYMNSLKNFVRSVIYLLLY